jgi:hypothetical protein
MSAVSIAWFAVSTGQSAEAWCLFREEHDGRMVSAGITATEKQIPLRFKAADTEIPE